MRLSTNAVVLAVCFGVRSVAAQVVEVSAGTSNAYDAQGAMLHLHSKGMDSQLGFGMVAGHFSAGGAVVRSVKGGTVTVGQQEMSANLPTDVFETRHTIFGTGIGIKRISPIGSLVAFTGATSLSSGTPLFQASSLGKISHFGQWTLPSAAPCRPTITALTGNVTVAIASVECVRSRALTLAVSAGIGGGAPYLAASAVTHTNKLDLKLAYVSAGTRFQRGSNPYQPAPEPVRENVSAAYRLSRSVTVNGFHGNYSTPAATDGGDGQSLPMQKSSLNTAGIQYDHRSFSASTTLLRSSFNAGQSQAFSSGVTTAVSASMRYSVGRVEWSETFLHSQGANGVRSTILSSSASLSLNARVRLSEGINVTGQGVTFSHGGSLLTRFSSFEADYQFFYVANRPEAPFQQALVLQADLQLPGRLTVGMISTISPTGTPLYTFQLGRAFSRGPSSSSRNARLEIGQSVLLGRVEDPSGAGVARAALMIGAERVYTDSDGRFLYRERRPHTHPLKVLTEEFVSADNFIVLDAPTEVRTGDAGAALVRVVVRKQFAGEGGPA